ncbi:DNA-directed RNA polymerase core subunit [Maudiozyma humilis]|uniref:DNA-directed RNA polymerase core subunit n=1 Tax=Maudiozyma humilis TaxID=51915 RepID=A0AAV5RRX6_MAUHU|nr:DNA-directed RNA polymerase core subunit [Kazachstania humilis]
MAAEDIKVTAAENEDVDMIKDETVATAQVIDPEQIANEDAEEEEEEEDEVDREKIKILPQATSEDGTCASFQILEEDHTLGNPLRYIIMKNPQVEFCGYSIPHPSENLLNLRIQTYGEITAVEALQKGLADLMDMCDAVEEKFTDRIKQL